MVIVRGRTAQQQVVHGDGRGGAEQREPADPRAVARSRLQRDQRAHAVADQGGLAHLRRVEHGRQPVRHRRNGGSGWPLGAAVAGQVDGQHAAAVPGEIARLELPDGVIEGRAVHEHRDRQAGIEGPAARGGEDARAVDPELHG